MSLKIHYSPDSDSRHTPLGNPFLESPDTFQLTATRDGAAVSPQWSESSNGLLIQMPSVSQIAGTWMLSGTGFGRATIKATVDKDEDTLEVCVGSVVIASADGSYWQVFPDGGIKSVPERDIHPDTKILLNNNAILSDLTSTSTATAVTCYLLNLKSYALKSK